MHTLEKIIFTGILTTSPLASANAQSCRDYKAQLESLLVLPAGKYEIRYAADIERKTIKQSDGRESYFFLPEESPYRDTFAYTYEVPRSQLVVVDSSTNGVRALTGNLSCTFNISYPPSGKATDLNLDVRVSDSGNVTFFIDASTWAFARKEGQDYAFNQISNYLKQRDSAALWQHANQHYQQAYNEAVSKQAEEEAERERMLDQATPKEHDCSKRAQRPAFWVSPQEKQASIRLKLKIGADGKILDTQFTGSSDPEFSIERHPGFPGWITFDNLRDAAIDYYKHCQFSPGAINGVSISAWTKEYTFQWGK